MHRKYPHCLGSGIGLRREHFDDIVDTDRTVDWLEIIPENFVARGGRNLKILEQCAERWPVICHGVSVSLGGPDPLNADYLSALRKLLRKLDAPYYTDHLCYASTGGVAMHDLLPLPFTDAAVRHTAGRIRELSDRLEIPVAVENITYYAVMPGSIMDEASFIRAVLEEADCYLLLDVNNIHVNAVNHGQDPRKTLDALPLERTVHIHVAGHSHEQGRIIDDHSAPVIDEVWQLYEAALSRLGPTSTLVEWDTRIPPLGQVLDQADHARGFLHTAKSS